MYCCQVWRQSLGPFQRQLSKCQRWHVLLCAIEMPPQQLTWCMLRSGPYLVPACSWQMCEEGTSAGDSAPLEGAHGSGSNAQSPPLLPYMQQLLFTKANMCFLVTCRRLHRGSADPAAVRPTDHSRGSSSSSSSGNSKPGLLQCK